jgi:peptidoglycan hydrolase CwlO-like protein
MALQDLMQNLDEQIKEHNDAKAALDAGTAALEELRKAIQQRQGDIDTEAAQEKSELEDVRAALQAIRDEADRQLAALGAGGGTTGQGGATTTTAPTPGPQSGQSTRLHHRK